MKSKPKNGRGPVTKRAPRVTGRGSGGRPPRRTLDRDDDSREIAAELARRCLAWVERMTGRAKERRATRERLAASSAGMVRAVRDFHGPRLEGITAAVLASDLASDMAKAQRALELLTAVVEGAEDKGDDDDPLAPEFPNPQPAADAMSSEFPILQPLADAARAMRLAAEASIAMFVPIMVDLETAPDALLLDAWPANREPAAIFVAMFGRYFSDALMASTLYPRERRESAMDRVTKHRRRTTVGVALTVVANQTGMTLLDEIAAEARREAELRGEDVSVDELEDARPKIIIRLAPLRGEDVSVDELEDGPGPA